MRRVYFGKSQQSKAEEQCGDLVLAFEAAEAARTEADLFAQRCRLADAQRNLAVNWPQARMRKT